MATNNYTTLNWAKQDPENKIGIFRGGDFTSPSNNLTFVLALIFSGVFFAMEFFAMTPLAKKWEWASIFVDPITRTANLPVVIPIVILFFWCCVILFIKGRKVKFQARALSLATVPHLRGLPMTQDPKLNSHSKLNCILACIAAEKAGADEALMLDINGFVNTTNACNFFVVKKDEVWTSTGDYCMNGITRQKVIDICRAESIPVYEKNFSLVEAYSADEAFLTGTFGAQTPVGCIDGRTIGTGELGPTTEHIRKLYKLLIEKECR